MRKNIKKLFYLVTFIVLIYLFSAINLEELLSILSNVDSDLLFFLAAAQIITQTLLAYKWHLLVKTTGHKIRFMTIFAIHLAGALVENITPSSKAGSEPTRIYLLHKEGVAIEDALAVASVGMYMEIIPFTVLLFLSFAYLIVNFTVLTSLIAVIYLSLIALVLLSLLGIFLYMNERFMVKILHAGLKAAKRFMSVKFDAETAVKNFKSSARTVMQDKTVLTRSLCVSVIVWLLYPLKIYIIFYSLGSDVTFAMVICVTFLACLVGMIPIFPGGVGMYEASAILLYSILGVPLVGATAAVIIGRVFTFWFVSMLGALTTIGLKINLLKT